MDISCYLRIHVPQGLKPALLLPIPCRSEDLLHPFTNSALQLFRLTAQGEITRERSEYERRTSSGWHAQRRICS